MGKAGYEGKCDKCGDDLPEIMELKVKPEEGGGWRTDYWRLNSINDGR